MLDPCRPSLGVIHHRTEMQRALRRPLRRQREQEFASVVAQVLVRSSHDLVFEQPSHVRSGEVQLSLPLADPFRKEGSEFS